jgi:hypothetical protein
VTRLDLDERHDAALRGHQIQLAAPVSPVAIEDPVSARLQPLRGELLAASPGLGPVAGRQGRVASARARATERPSAEDSV